MDIHELMSQWLETSSLGELGSELGLAGTRKGLGANNAQGPPTRRACLAEVSGSHPWGGHPRQPGVGWLDHHHPHQFRMDDDCSESARQRCEVRTISQLVYRSWQSRG